MSNSVSLHLSITRSDELENGDTVIKIIEFSPWSSSVIKTLCNAHCISNC